MKQISAEEIRKKALNFNEARLNWHFHILTPTCKFNKKKQYAFVLEGPDKDQIFVYYSDSPLSDLGKELAPLAHKAKILDAETTEKNYKPSKQVAKIITRAKELNSKQIRWRHHVISRTCMFTTNSAPFVLVFEDPETGKTIENPTDVEPINDLKQIEPLFYSQK